MNKYRSENWIEEHGTDGVTIRWHTDTCPMIEFNASFECNCDAPVKAFRAYPVTNQP